MQNNIKDKKRSNFISKIKSASCIFVKKHNRLDKTSKLSQSLSIIEVEKKELSDDEKCDLEIFSILNGTPDADAWFRYDGDETVVDENVFYKPIQYGYSSEVYED